MMAPPETRIQRKPERHWAALLAGVGLTAASALAFGFPVPVLISILGVIGLVSAVRFPSYALFLYAVTAVLFFQAPLPSGTGMSVAFASGALFLVATVLHLVVTGLPGRLHSLLPRALLLLATVLLLNGLVNIDWVRSRPHGIATLWALCATTYCVPLVVRHPKSAWKLGTVLVLGAIAISLVAVYESATGQYNPFGLFPSSPEGRAYGLADPNYTAALLVTLLPFLVAHLVCGGSTLAKALAVLGIAFSLVAIEMTASRGGVVGLVVTVLAVLLWVSPKRDREGPERQFSRLRGWIAPRKVLIPVLLLCLGVAVSFAPRLLWERLATLQDWSHPEDVKESRVQLWSDYVERWLESPWWGHGPGYFDPDLVGQSTQFPHNTPLEALLEVGLVGFAPYLLLNGLAFAEAIKARQRFGQRGEYKLSTLSGAVATSLIGFHSTAFFLTSFSHKELWLLVGFAGALHSLSWRMGSASPRSPGLEA